MGPAVHFGPPEKGKLTRFINLCLSPFSSNVTTSRSRRVSLDPPSSPPVNICSTAKSLPQVNDDDTPETLRIESTEIVRKIAHTVRRNLDEQFDEIKTATNEPAPIAYQDDDLESLREE